jgi:microcin C transport system permease protein
MIRKIAYFLIISSVLAVIAELIQWTLPTISWAFNASYDGFGKVDLDDGGVFAWFGYLVALLGIGVGVLILKSFDKNAVLLPTTMRRIERFKANKRGLISFYIILFVVFLASLDQLIVGKKALFLSLGEETHFPAFERARINGKDIGLKGDRVNTEVDYRRLKKEIKAGERNGKVIMPMVPYDPAQDTVEIPYRVLEEKNGVLIGDGDEPFDGMVSTLYDGNTSKRHMVYKYRKGLKQGAALGKARDNEKMYQATYDKGLIVEGTEEYFGVEMSQQEFLADGGDELVDVRYFASAPLIGGHLLGTNTKGNDLVAYLYGGLQLNIKAAIIYIPAIYSIGVAIGLLMGFFGGAFDIIIQRLIEIFSTIPFLFVVIIISDMIPSENRGLGIILFILIAFGWMGMTYLMRTAALREKARDYVAAARVSGASTSRILFSHILPNTVAILVTLVPFSISGIIVALTSLDYLGFGLPPEYATWGLLLKDGLANYSKPWLVASSFTALVCTLTLVTFVGEAVRDAFDPKKFTTYK